MAYGKKIQKIGVLLLNLGGPEKLKDVRPFLYNLFSDRRIIRLGPPFLQKPIAALIARKRAPTSIANYQKIGGGSPINTITTNQARALSQSLENDGDFMVRPCMRYWPPYAETVIREMVQDGVTELIGLPLYPHYSEATTGSSLHDLQLNIKKHEFNLPVREIRSWPIQPQYITCMVKRIKEGVARLPDPVQVVYSAHSLPKKFIDEGDPYVTELKQTIKAVEQQTGLPGKLCYQSRSGPVEWLEPSTPDMLKKLAAQGCTNILMVPISFVSDHIETLYEISMLYKNQAQELGMRLECSRGLNDDPDFISTLHSLVLSTYGVPQ